MKNNTEREATYCPKIEKGAVLEKLPAKGRESRGAPIPLLELNNHFAFLVLRLALASANGNGRSQE